MDNIKRLVIAAGLSLCGLSVQAGYAQLAPPERFSGSYPDFKFAPSANDARYGKIAYQPNGFKVPVPGTAARMPAAYRFAANAPRVAAAALFLHPGVRTAIGIATWLGIAKLVWDEASKSWVNIEPKSLPGDTDTEYMNSAVVMSSPWFKTHEEACLYAAGYLGYNFLGISGNSCNFAVIGKQITVTRSVKKDPCPIGWTESPAGCLSPAISQPNFLEKLSPKPMPDTVPWELPFPTPLPVDPPYINPEPGTDPKHQPLFVPTGDPVPNPNYNPSAPPSPDNQPWIQPGTKVVPSPTPQSPLQVDLQPVNRPVNSPESKPDPVRDPVKPPITPPDPNNPPDPNAPPDPDAPPKDQPKPEEQQSLCEKHPDIVACAKLGSIGPDVINNEQKAMEITPDTGYGPSNGSCPAPRTATIMGKAISMPFDLICQFADAIRPIVIGFAWLAAAMTFFGFSRRD